MRVLAIVSHLQANLFFPVGLCVSAVTVVMKMDEKAGDKVVYYLLLLCKVVGSRGITKKMLYWQFCEADNVSAHFDPCVRVLMPFPLAAPHTYR